MLETFHCLVLQNLIVNGKAAGLGKGLVNVEACAFYL